VLQLKATTFVQGHHHLQFFSRGAIGDVELMDNWRENMLITTLSFLRIMSCVDGFASGVPRKMALSNRL
jgi:hypothetical protein